MNILKNAVCSSIYSIGIHCKQKFEAFFGQWMNRHWLISFFCFGMELNRVSSAELIWFSKACWRGWESNMTEQINCKLIYSVWKEDDNGYPLRKKTVITSAVHHVNQKCNTHWSHGSVSNDVCSCTLNASRSEVRAVRMCWFFTNGLPWQTYVGQC